MDTYRMGIDVGSTTVKAVVLGEKDQVMFSDYRRHHAQIQETLTDILCEIRAKLGEYQRSDARWL